MRRSKTKDRNCSLKAGKRFNSLAFGSAFCVLIFGFWVYSSCAQDTAAAPKPVTPGAPAAIEMNLDVNSKTVPLPKIYSPNINLSGRGFHKDPAWPYHIASPEAIETWAAQIGFKGMYRLHWNLWEIEQARSNPELHKKLLANYESIIKRISDGGGTVVLSLFGTPPGKGDVLDKRSPPLNIKQWKQMVKRTMRYLSCQKKYNIWYEVWDSPDTDNFFLGDKKDYLSLYRMAAEAVRELNNEKFQRRNKIKISIGGPSVTWWFQNIGGNTIHTPEESLIYELIKLCRTRKLPLDFISWHTYSTDPRADQEATNYNKSPTGLIRDWLKYFRIKNEVSLVVDEWNYDSGLNILEERNGRSYIGASYIPSRIKNMNEAGLDRQIFYCLEDFQNNKEGINSNRGAFGYDDKSSVYKGSAKSIYNIFLMLKELGDSQYTSLNLSDEFVGAIATKKDDNIILLLWNYIDPDAGRSLLSRSVGSLNDKGRVNLVGMVKSGKLDDILNQKAPLGEFSTDKLKALFKKIYDLMAIASSSMNNSRDVKITLSNLKGGYLYQRYTVDDSCGTAYCPFVPVEEKQIQADNIYQETQALKPYSVNLVVLKKSAPVAVKQ